jgi:hypothetical protein
MSGWLTNGVPNLPFLTGAEQFSVDTENSGGAVPQTGSVTIAQLVAAVAYFGNTLSKTPVDGTRYYVGVTIGFDTTLTGISALIGATGGTDKFIFELHDSAGTLVATTATAGVTVGTALTWQQIPFTAEYSAVAGDYFIAVQLNGTTARLATYNSPTSPLVTGSAAGTFGTGAAIAPPTTYTAGVGPVTVLY